MEQTIVLILLLSFQVAFGAGHQQTKDLKCFTAGECTKSSHIDGLVTKDEFDCLKKCQANSDCAWFTFYQRNNYCHLMSNCNNLEETFCQDCVSGEQACTVPEPVCWITGECLGTFLHVEVEIETGDDCLNICKKTDGCAWFTHDQRSSTCLLMADCDNFDETCKECVSGESRCYVQEPTWHMIFGGNGQSENLNSVELYNWKTGEQCELESRLPFPVAAHSGTVLDGVPVFCGGVATLTQGPETSNKCYKLNTETMAWERISDLLGETFYADGVNVPSHGWVIFGGDGAKLTTGQKLRSVDSEWEEGPALYENSPDSTYCLTQINDTTTAYLSGRREELGIKTFDWTSMAFTTHEQTLTQTRRYSTCALLKGANGEKIVAIAGGTSPGMEGWNPDDGTQKVFSEDFPPLNGDNRSPKMLSVNGNSELIYYDTLRGDFQPDKGIWKFNLSNNSWTQVGELIQPRDDFVVLPVHDVSCP